MAKQKNKQDKLSYKHYINAVCLTMHTQDGSELTPEALTEAENAIWAVAQKYGYLINIANT